MVVHHGMVEIAGVRIAVARGRGLDMWFHISMHHRANALVWCGVMGVDAGAGSSGTE